MHESRIDLLLVEDSVDDRAFVSYFMQQLGGVTVRVAQNGAEALEMMFGRAEGSQQPPILAPRVIVLDLHLPKIGGLELIRHFKSNPHTHAIPLVALSASADRHDAEDCYLAGANSYIVKPTEFAEFGRVVTLLGQYWLRLNLAPDAAGE